LKLLLMIVWLAAIPAVCAAQVTPASAYTPPDDSQAIRVGATLFYDYTYQDTPKIKDADGNDVHQNTFNVSRAYINIIGNVSHLVSFRITPDIVRDNDAGAVQGNLVYRLKYGFAQINLDDWTGDWKGTWVRAGIQQTPYIDYAEGIYRYRFQGTIFVEREQIGGNLTSSDGGVSFHTGLPSNYGEVHVGVYNGEGYSKLETNAPVNSEKAFQIRATFRPLATNSMVAARGLRVTFFWDKDHYVQNAPRDRFVFNTTYEHKYFNLGYDYLNGQDQQNTIKNPNLDSRGWSFWVTPFFHEKGNGLEALLRVDRFTPDNTTPANTSQQKQRFIGGLAYWFPHPGGAATAAVLLDYEQVKFDQFPDAPANAQQKRIAVHGLINF
jgi:hypothetical protein